MLSRRTADLKHEDCRINFCRATPCRLPPLKIALPALAADGFPSAFPSSQAGYRDARVSGEGSDTHSKIASVCLYALSLSIGKELTERIRKIRLRDLVECSQLVHQFCRDVLCDAAFDVAIHHPRDSHALRHFTLGQPLTVAKPAEPVRYIVNFLVLAVPPMELLRLLQPTRSAQREAMDIQGQIPHMRILCAA